jgi:hypothetical protein
MTSGFHPELIPWSEYPMECFWYFYLLWVPHLLLFLVVGSILALLPANQRSQRLRRILRFGLFLVLFLVVGSLFNGLWSCTVYIRFYESSDYAFGFFPFGPLTQSLIEPRLDQDGMPILRVSFLQLQLIWVLFASGTWAATIFLYRIILRGFRGTFAAAEC